MALPFLPVDELAVEPERRRFHRHRVSLPVVWDKGSGTTRDVGIHGVYIETQELVLPGSELSFDLRGDGTEDLVPDWFACTGDVVRVEATNGLHGVAVRLKSVRFRGEKEANPL